jgi:hypothetical protein
MISPWCGFKLGYDCMVIDGRLEESLEAVEAAVPTLVVPITGVGIGELLVGDDDFGCVAFRGKVNRDEGVAHGTTFPAPGVDELAWRIDDAVGAENGVNVAAFVGDGDAVLVIDAKVDSGLGGAVVGGSKPLAELIGIGPRLEDAFDRCGIGAGDYERRG